MKSQRRPLRDKRPKAKARPKIDPDDELLTQHDVAKRLKISLRSVWYWAAQGRIAAVRIGPHSTRFSRSSIEKLIQAGA